MHRKCAGLGDSEARRQVLPTSELTVASLVTHLRWTEWHWFERSFLGAPARDASLDWVVGSEPLDELLDAYDAQCARSRTIVEQHDFDEVEAYAPAGIELVSLRWIVGHVVEDGAAPGAPGPHPGGPGRRSRLLIRRNGLTRRPRPCRNPTVEDTERNLRTSREDKVILDHSAVKRTGVAMSGTAPTTRSVFAALFALVLGLLGGLVTPAAEAATGALTYSCEGPGFGSPQPYIFQVAVDTDLPATLPYGSQRTTTWNIQVVAPDSFRSWAQAFGQPNFDGGAQPGTTLDGAAQQSFHLATPALAVPTTSGPWTWPFNPSTTTVPASAPGRHTLTLASLTLTIAFTAADGSPRYLTSATCVLDPSVPLADTTIDTYDTVAATTTTALVLKGDTATAIVTSSGVVPDGTVTFSVGGKSVTMGVVSGKATAQLPSVPPGAYTVSAQFVPTQPSQLTTSTGTASYVAPRIVTKTKASASYRFDRGLLKARARVSAVDGSDVSGRVTFILKRNGRTIDNATVRMSSRDVAIKKFRDVKPTGRYLVVAKYLGNSAFVLSTARARLTLP